MGRLNNAWKALFAGDAPRSAGGLLAGIMASGQAPRRGTRELLQAYKRLPYVHSAFHRVAHDVASIPFRIWRRKRSGTKAYLGVGGSIRKQVIDEARTTGDLVAIDRHPFLDVLCTMNPALGAHSSRAVTQLFLDLKGEGFWVKELNSAQQPVELWPVPPHWIAEMPTASHPFYRASFSGWQRTFPEACIKWFRMPDPENPYGRGTGLGESLGDELDIDEQSTKYLKNWFFRNAIPPAILNLKGASRDEVERFKERLGQEHRGVNGAHQLFVSNAEEMEVQQLSQTFQDQDLTQLRKASREIVLQVLNIPPEIFGIIENSNRATIDSADYLYSRGVLCPRMDFQVDALQSLLSEFDENLLLDYVSPVPEDREFKKAIFLAAPQGTFTRNEVRALAGEQPVEGGDEEAKEPQLFQYHFMFGVITLNEARARLGLPPVPGGDQPPAPIAGFGPGAPPAEMSVDAEWVKAIAPPASLPQPRRKALVDVESVLESLRPDRLRAEVDPLWEARLQKWGDKALRELGIADGFNIRNPLVRDHLDEFGATKISGIVHETTRADIRDTLSEGMAAGEGIRELQSRVMDVFSVADKVRAQRIARTEVVGSSNFASVSAFEQSGVVASKEWLSVRDGSTRQEHADLDGQIVTLRARFKAPSGESASHPGGFGIASLDINCRCACLPVVDDAKAVGLVVHRAMTEDEKVAVWKRFDQRLIPWEKVAIAALRRGFAKQEQDVLEALERLT